MNENLGFAPPEEHSNDSDEAAVLLEKQANFEAIVKRLQNHFETKKNTYQAITGRNFKFRFGEHTAFDHRRREVIIGVDDIIGLGVINEQNELDDQALDFLVFHELGHYRELYDDPDGYLGLIDGLKQEKHGPAIFRLYNCLMDIYANRTTANNSPLYRGKGKEMFSQEVKNFYTQKAFNRDNVGEKVKQKQMGLADQFATYLLNAGMGVGEDYYQCLDKRVQEVIDQGLKKNGVAVSCSEFIDDRLSPVLDKKQNYQASISNRQSVVNRVVLPIYLQLLEEDQHQQQQQQAGQGEGQGQPAGEGQGEASDGQGDSDDWQTPEGQRVLEEIKKIKEILTQDALPKKAQESMTPEEKAKKQGQDSAVDSLYRATDKMQEQLKDSETDGDLSDLIREYLDGMSERDLQEAGADFYERMVQMRPIIEKLQQLWERICHETVIEERQTQRRFKVGRGLNIQDVVKQYATLTTKPENARVMEQRVIHETKDRVPKQFHLNLMLDISGSMGGNIEHLRNFFIAIASSLERFNSANLDRYNKRELTQPVAGLLDIYFFDQNIYHVLKGDRKTLLDDVMGAYLLLKEHGATSANTEERVLQDISKRDEVAANSGKLKDDVIEISLAVTDGENSSSSELQQSVAQLRQMGVIAGGIFLGDSIPSGFHQIYPPEISLNTPDAEGLPEVMEQLLEKVLQPPDEENN